MRTYSSKFAEKNAALRKETRWVVALSFDDANTDVHYFTSHDDCEVPSGTSSSDVTYNVLRNPVVTSQKLDVRNAKSSVGSITFDLVDRDSVVTNLLNTKLSAGDGVRHKQVVIYRGYAGIPWADYQIPPGGTQVVDGKLSAHRGRYTFRCRDRQRSMQEDVFDVKKTTLTSSIGPGETVITVGDTSELEMVAHGASFTDAPNRTVGYVKTEKEKIRWTSKTSTAITVDNNASTLSAGISAGAATVPVTDASAFRSSGVGNITDGANISNISWTGKSGNTLTGVSGVETAFLSGDDIYDAIGRGVLNTKAVAHDVDTSADQDRRTPVEEVIYLEMPATKLAYAILTGILYNQSGATLPSHWHLGISTSYVSTAAFTGIGTDLWDTSDDTAGFVLRFDNLTKRKAKKFIQEQINLPQACFMPVLSDGQLGYRRSSRLISSASPVARLDASNVTRYSVLDHDQGAVSNRYRIDWNYDYSKDDKGRPTRTNEYIDTSSVGVHKNADIYHLKFEGLHGSRHTDAVIRDTFNALRDRYSGPPLLISVDCHQSLNGVEIGDVVWCDFNQRDFVGGGDLDRAFEVIGCRDDGHKVTLTLFGSSRPAGALASTTASTVLDSTFYNTGLAAGNELSSATTGSLTGGVWHITGDSTLTGGADMNSTSNIYWYDGDVQIDSGVTLTLSGNVQLRIGGNLHYDGTIDVTGGGYAGATAAESQGVSGFIGNTVSGGGLNSFPTLGFPNLTDRPGIVTKGANDTAPELSLTNNGTSISGIPSDMRPTSGGSGGDIVGLGGSPDGSGGDGGAGAGALIVICKSASHGVNGVIDSSGSDGNPGAAGPFAVAGTGAGGYAGPIYFLIDGSSSTVPSSSSIISRNGDSPVYGHLLSEGRFLFPKTSTNIGTPATYVGESVFRVQYIKPQETAVEDIAEETSPPTAITIQEAVATNNSMNLVALEISVTPPGDGNYRGAMIYIKQNGTNSYQPVGEARGTEEVVFYVPADGGTYSVKAHPVSIFGVESDDFYGPVSHTVASTQEAVIGNGNSLATITNPSTNGGMVIDETGINSYDNTGQKTFDVAASDGSVIAGVVADEKYIKFNGTTGDIELGRDTELRGADSFNNKSTYWHTFFESADALSVTGSVSIVSTGLQVAMQGDGTPTTAYFLRDRRTSSAQSWNNDRSIRVILRFPFGEAGHVDESYVGMGGDPSTSGNKFVGFKLVYASYTQQYIYGVVDDGTTETLTSSSITTIHLAWNELIVEFVSATSAKFYANGTLLGTISTNLPTGNTSANNMFFARVAGYSSPATAIVEISEYAFWQDN